MEAIITVVGEDKTDVVAGASAKVAGSGSSIGDISQTVLDDFFTMMTTVSSDGRQDFICLRPEFETYSETLDVEINTQSEATFDATYSI